MSAEVKSEVVVNEELEGGGENSAAAAVEKAGAGDTHRLFRKWALHYVDGAKINGGADFDNALSRIHAFDTVEGFWRLWNYVKEPNMLDDKSAFCIFEDSVKPAWEDTAHSDGAHLQFQFSNRERAQNVITTWRNIVLSMIGEQFGDDGTIISGAYLTAKKGNMRFQIWLKSSDRDAGRRIATILREVISEALGEKFQHKIDWKVFHESGKDTF